MAATFEALGDFLDDFLELPIPIPGQDGEIRTYRIEGPSALDGIQIERITTMAARLAAGGSVDTAPALDDEEEIDLYRKCLGDAYGPLLADLSWVKFRHVALTAMMWITADRETAAAYWATGTTAGKAPNRAARRSAQRGSSASAGASTTRKPASTSGTKAASPRARKAAAVAPH